MNEILIFTNNNESDNLLDKYLKSDNNNSPNNCRNNST